MDVDNIQNELEFGQLVELILTTDAVLTIRFREPVLISDYRSKIFGQKVVGYFIEEKNDCLVLIQGIDPKGHSFFHHMNKLHVSKGVIKRIRIIS